MDFYARQEKARRKTGQIIALFCLSLVLILAVANFVVYAFTVFLAFRGSIRIEGVDIWHVGSIRLHVILSLSLLALFALISWRHMSKLAASGGDWLAGRLGGVFVDPLEPGSGPMRQLVNVVEEMAIAAGIPMPSIYMLGSETGINALAAGWDYENAVIVVSHGALSALSRDELQGVIAHEMAHILSGDMRLNIRLVGLLHGFLIFREISHGLNEPGSKGNKPLSGLAVLFAIVGFLGEWCARLVRAGISRQREFLADAQAVQLTRNPYGIANALKKIGGFSEGSLMKTAKREEVSHMFFASGQTFWTRLMATHPPIEERIRAIDNSFSAKDFPEAKQQVATATAFQDSGMVSLREAGAGDENTVPGTSEAALQATGQTSQGENLFYGSLLQDTAGCETALLAALLRACGKMRKRSERIESGDTAAITDITGEAIYAQMRLFLAKVQTLPPEHILPLAEMALAKLDILPKSERTRIIHMLDRLAAMDGELILAEYCLTRLARLYLEKKTVDAIQPKPSAAQLRQALIILFAVMAWSGDKDEKAAARAFDTGMNMLLPKTAPSYVPVRDWVVALDEALEFLPALSENVRKQVIIALVATAGDDGGVCLEETELLRLVCASLKLPMPPIDVRRSE